MAAAMKVLYLVILQNLANGQSFTNNNCRQPHKCLLLHYNSPPDPKLKGAFLKCSHYGLNDKFDRKNGNWNLQSKKNDMFCSYRPDCNLVFDNNESQMCIGSDVVNSYGLMDAHILTVRYQPCKDISNWSFWSKCEKDLQYRFTLCNSNKGHLYSYQVRICTSVKVTPSSKVKSTFLTSSMATEFTRTSIFTTPILTKTHKLATLRSTFTTLSSQSTQVLLTTTSRVSITATITATSSSSVLASSVVPQKAYCPSEAIGDASYKGKYIFPKTAVNTNVFITCQYGYIEEEVKVFRTCLLSASGKAFWSELDMSNCAAESEISNKLIKLLKKPITSETVQNVTRQLKNVLKVSKPIEAYQDIDNIVSIIDKCVQKSGGDITITTDIFDSINSLLNVDDKVLSKSKSTKHLLKLLESLAEELIKNGKEVSFSSQNIAFGNVQVRSEVNLWIQAEKKNDVETLSFGIEEPSENITTSIMLPKNIWKKESNQVYSFSFNSDNFFKRNEDKGLLNKKRVKVGSKVISASIYESVVENLKEDKIQLSFEVTDENATSCGYWEEKSSVNHWSTKGCYRNKITRVGNKKIVHCACNHLTNFAILLAVDDNRQILKELDIISFIGCLISIAALLVTVVIYTAFRELRRSVPHRILINLCLSLAALLAIFIAGVDKTKSAASCHSVSVLIHFFTVSTFLWMAVESVSLYRSVVKIFKRRTNKKLFFWCCFAAAWGIPAVLSGITSYFTEEQFKEENNFCVIKGNLFIITTLFPVSCILILNTLLFVPIIRQIHGHLKKKEKFQTKKNPWRRVRVTISSTVILGLTWIFGVIALGDLRLLFQWLFTLLNSLQGLFIFIFHVILNYDVQQTIRRVLGYKYRKQTMSRSKTSTIRLAAL